MVRIATLQFKHLSHAPIFNAIIFHLKDTCVIYSPKRSNHNSSFKKPITEPMEEQYPKVKVRVRQEEDADQLALELTSLQSLKGFVSLSRYDSFSDDSPTSIVRIPGPFIASPPRSEDLEITEGSPTAIVRVPGSSISTSATCEDPAFKGTSTKKEVGFDGSKTNIRANLVSRPRAVLSSPDNDTMIGSTNKTRKELPSTGKSNNLIQSRHTQNKVMPGPVSKGSHKSRASTTRTDHGKTNLHAGGQLVNNVPSKISSHLKGKTEPPRRKISSKPTNDK